MSRRALTASLVAFVLVSLGLVAGLLLTIPDAVGASGVSALQTPVPPPGGRVVPTVAVVAEGTHRPVTRQDWINETPIFCAMTLFVVVVDALVIGRVIYNLRKERAATAAVVNAAAARR